jgi:hypothetical protein
MSASEDTNPVNRVIVLLEATGAELTQAFNATRSASGEAAAGDLAAPDALRPEHDPLLARWERGLGLDQD